MPDWRPTAIDLFAGCGGLTLGLKQAGFDVLAAIEIDEIAAKTYLMNHPEVEMWEDDIRDVHPADMMDELRLGEFELDLLAGCPPCQGFSSITTLNGKHQIDDDRNDLVLQFLLYVQHLWPKAVMLENVPGLAQDARFDRLCSGLRRLGYHVKWDVLNAADYGVPQRRRRLILIASLLGTPAFATPSGKRRTVRNAISKLPPPGKSGDPVHDFPENRTDHVRRYIKQIRKNGGSRMELGKRKQLPCHQDCNGFKDIYGRMAWDDVSPTITSGCFNPSKGRFLHPTRNRAITMREAALLQSFPLKYVFATDRGKTHVAEMIGNALPPPFIRAHAVTIKQHMNSNWQLDE